MKVFVPMSDNIETKGALSGKLVPFNPEFLRAAQDSRPANWIVDCDYATACRRLHGQSTAVESHR